MYRPKFSMFIFLVPPFVTLTGLALIDMCYDLPVNSFYEHPVNVIPFFRYFSVKIPLDIYSKHPTLFITISNRYIRCRNKHSTLNIR